MSPIVFIMELLFLWLLEAALAPELAKTQFFLVLNCTKSLQAELFPCYTAGIFGNQLTTTPTEHHPLLLFRASIIDIHGHPHVLLLLFKSHPF